jgi:hypothetical protein
MLKSLEGHEIWSLVVAANMLMIQFGERTRIHIPVLDRRKTVGALGLHVQSHWEISQDGEVVFQRSDFSSDDQWLEKSAEFKRFSKRIFREKQLCTSLHHDGGGFTFAFGEHVLTVEKSAYGAESWRVLDHRFRFHHVYKR